MPEQHDVIVVGAGQGGLSTSYFLTAAGIEHIVLDRGGIAHAWQAGRWDSFCLVTPNWTITLPGATYAGNDPGGFMLRDDFAGYMKRWAAGFGAPVRAGVEVTAIAPHGAGFRVTTDGGDMTASAVVVATATYQHPRIPPVAGRIPPQIAKMHAEAYKNPAMVPGGAVMVVGSGQTGCQLVDDLTRAGREVYLCVGRAGRLPRRYRGRDSLEWQRDMKLLDRTPDMLDSPAQRFVGDPHVSGRDGGRTLSLHDFHASGVHLLARLEDVDGMTMRFGGNLVEDMRHADQFAADFMAKVDAHIAAGGLDAPPPSAQELSGAPPSADWTIPEPDSLDLQQAGIGTIIWATGFDYDFSWIDLPIHDEMGYPETDRGATAAPGLYFCGLNWMHKRKSGIIYGVGEDAEHVSGHLAAYLAALPGITREAIS